MTGMQTLEARAALGVVALAATLAVSRSSTLSHLPERRFDRVYLLLFAGVRLFLFALIFLVLRLPVRGDVVGYYVPELLERLHGGVPYRDFGSSYAPLASYGNAALYRLHASPLTLVLFAILVENVAAAVWLRVLRLCVSNRTAQLAALLCLVNPVSLQFVTVDGQNNVLISLFLALAVLALRKESAARSGGWLAVAISTVKFLPLLCVPSFVAYAGRDRRRWLAAFGATLLVVYGFFQFVLHAPVLSAFGREGGIKSASGLPYVVEAVTGHDFGLRLWDGLMLALLAGLVLRTLLLVRRWQMLGLDSSSAAGAQLRAVMASATGLLVTLMAFSKKTWPTYTEIVLFPLALAVATRVSARRTRAAVVWFGVFSVLAVTAQSVWASVLNQAPALLLHAELVKGQLSAWAFLALELALLLLYVWLIRVCLREERAAVDGAPA